MTTRDCYICFEPSGQATICDKCWSRIILEPRFCAHCGKEIHWNITYGRMRWIKMKYCSTSCRDSAKAKELPGEESKLSEHTCLGCKRIFRSRKNRSYCSHACREINLSVSLGLGERRRDLIESEELWAKAGAHFSDGPVEPPNYDLKLYRGVSEDRSLCGSAAAACAESNRRL